MEQVDWVLQVVFVCCLNGGTGAVCVAEEGEMSPAEICVWCAGLLVVWEEKLELWNILIFFGCDKLNFWMRGGVLGDTFV